MERHINFALSGCEQIATGFTKLGKGKDDARFFSQNSIAQKVNTLASCDLQRSTGTETTVTDGL